MVETFTEEDIKTAAKFAAAAMWRLLKPEPAVGDAKEFLIGQAASVGVLDALIVKDLVAGNKPVTSEFLHVRG